MFANPTNVGISQRVVATLVACAVAMVSIGFFSYAQAANLTSVSDTLTDSKNAVVSNHTIAFTMSSTGSVAASGGTITATFPSGFDLSTIVVGDIDLTINGSAQTLVAGAAGAGNWGYTKTGSGPTTITFTAGSGVSAAANNPIIIKIGTNTVTGGVGTHQIVNPALGSYELYITAGTTDTGRTRVAIISSVLVSAIVDTTFTFTITGTATNTAMFAATTTGSTSPTVINFGRLVANVPKILAQHLAVVTNARNGFNVTMKTSQQLTSSNGADIDSFSNATDVATPTAWSSPTNSIANENTWGHWGWQTNDVTLSGTAFASNQYEAASTTPRSVMYATTSADGTTQNIGKADVGYKIQITPLQEAADDYNATLTYVATPVF
jgi:hypothetical protein